MRSRFLCGNIDGDSGLKADGEVILVDRSGVAGVTCGLQPAAAAPDNGLAAPVVPVDAPEEFAAVAAENNLGKAVIASWSPSTAIWRNVLTLPNFKQ